LAFSTTFKKKKKKAGAGGTAQAECLLNKCKALSSKAEFFFFKAVWLDLCLLLMPIIRGVFFPQALDSKVPQNCILPLGRATALGLKLVGEHQVQKHQ
jgi:hypothetical protein